ncbi:MAG TPA: hypothetical protein PKD61_03165 [Polyangiaceae bacterium]|nr:hypothetical protein [Polyangiaceae bacterium]
MTRPLSVSVPLPSTWRASVQRAVLCAISLAHLSLVQTRAWCADSRLWVPPRVSAALTRELAFDSACASSAPPRRSPPKLVLVQAALAVSKG